MTHRRIAIAGFQHETNTFAPSAADWHAFEMADSWPGMLRGGDVITGTQGMNLPIAGAIEAAIAADIEIVPILWCAAEPSGPVTDDAFTTIAKMIEDGVTDAGPIDALYLDLHGAMVTETHDDGEGALVTMLRAATGPDLPIAVSLDLHANLSSSLVDNVDVITIYRTYPHLDMADTGHRAIAQIQNMWKRNRPLAVAFRPVPYLIPLHAQYTGAPPCADLYAALDSLIDPASGAAHASAYHASEYIELALGFTAADITDCGPSIVAYASDQARANELADAMLETMCTAAPTFDTRMLTPHAAVKAAMAHEGVSVLADVQDNPGAGGASDTTGLLRALIAARARHAVLGVLCDPALAAMAHQQGPGAIMTCHIGGKSDGSVDAPVPARARVMSLSDGDIHYTGAMYGGGVARLGPSCVLAIEGDDCDIHIIVSSQRIQCLDQALFEQMGVPLGLAKIICVKSTVHYRADFDALCDQVMAVAAPGLFPCDLATIPYRKATRKIL